MNIDIIYGLSQPKAFKGCVVIIDVWRACTTMCCLFERGIKEILLASNRKDALDLKGEKAGALTLGEHRGQQFDDFDLGNSPNALLSMNLTGKSIVMMTSNCTRGVHAIAAADSTMCAGFVNAQTTIDHIVHQGHEQLTLVAMGNLQSNCPADIACAEYLADRLTGKSSDIEEIRGQLLKSSEAQKFYDDSKQNFPVEDLAISLGLNTFPLPLKVYRKGDRIIVPSPYGNA